MGFLQITLRALIEESNILLQMWDQNNKGHRKNPGAGRTWRIQRGEKKYPAQNRKPSVGHTAELGYQFFSEEKTDQHQNPPMYNV